MSKKTHAVQEPIFIHSLFRSGSTYIFNVFRRSQALYCCYQEPLNEHLLYAATDPEKLLEQDRKMQLDLRHPKLEKPYLYEFYKIANRVGSVFREEFSYDQYFSSNNDDLASIKDYFSVLINGAQGRPVFQCSRSMGRVAQLKLGCGGVHVFLWRNPWDQWWSYKKDAYFETRNLLILNSKELPEFLNALKAELTLPLQQHDINIEEYDFIDNRHWLSTEGSYKLFYGLWCHAKLEAEPLCDLAINIDDLSSSSAYCNDIIKSLESLGIAGLDFSDCLIPQASYGDSDGKFFLKIESYIHGLLLLHGYSHDQVGRLIQLSDARSTGLVDTTIPENVTIRDAMRAREYLYLAETELTYHWNLMMDVQRQLQLSETIKEQLEKDFKQSEAINTQSEAINAQLELSKDMLENEAYSAKEEISALNKENLHFNVNVKQLEEELKAVYASKSWRIMLQLRKILHLLIRLSQQFKQLASVTAIFTMRFVIKYPLLKETALAILSKFPRIKNYLNKRALRAGLSTKQSYRKNLGTLDYLAYGAEDIASPHTLIATYNEQDALLAENYSAERIPIDVILTRIRAELTNDREVSADE